MIDFKGRNILMFSPYGATKHYGEAIKDELLKRGAKVKGYDERPSQNALMKIIIRFLKKDSANFCKIHRFYNQRKSGHLL